MAKAKKITKQVYLQWYEDMLFWRRFENKASALYIQQKIRGFLHLYNGQEGVLAGSIFAMQENDRMITAYRNHVQPIGLGVDPKYVMAELMGKRAGCSHGNGGSMHMFSKEHNFFGGHGIVGGQIPLGAGLAFADKYLESDSVTLCSMGDGAVRQGSFHETMNLAMLWDLPVVFIIENNGYAMGTSVQRTSKEHELYKLGLGYNMTCDYFDGMNPVTSYKAINEAMEFARSGKGPVLLEARTYRYKGHSMSDAQPYRTKDEVKEYEKQDPITIVQDIILDKDYATQKELDEIDERVKKGVNDCVKFADKADFPVAADLYKDVYKQEDYPFINTH